MKIHSLFRRGFALPALLAVALLVACGGGGGGGAAPPPAAGGAPTVIGSAGGVVDGPDGVSVTVPAGALAADTTLQIVATTPAAALALPAGIAAAPRMYSLLPHGVRFSVPVTLSVPAAAGDPADSTVLKTNAAGTAWEQLVTTNAGGSHSALIVSFSYMMMCNSCVPPAPPVITMQPASGSVTEGGLVFLSVSAIGAQPLEYTWTSTSRGGFGPQASPGIVVNPVTMADDGMRLTVQVKDRFGQVAVSSPGLVTVIPRAPVIVSEPDANVDAIAGTTAEISALTTSSVSQELNWQRFDPMSQQWGGSLSSSNRLLLPNVQVATHDQALYRMTARNVGSLVETFTRTARLTVLPAETMPVIVTPPQDVATVAGRSAVFGVVASGGGLIFDWYRNDGPGGTFQRVSAGNGSAQLVLSNVTVADDGAQFQLVVHNTVGQAPRQDVQLVVAPSVGSAPVRVDGGISHSVALRADATLVAWGGNGLGQLGRGTFTTTEGAQAVSGLSRVATFAVGAQHTLAIDDQGVVSSWGTGSNGVLGDPGVNGRNLPGPVVGLGGPARFVSAGRTKSVAATGSDFYSWGTGYHGDSLWAFRATPTALAVNGFVVASAGRGDHTLGISGDGTVWAWGHNSYGQLGTGDFGARIAPEVVTGLPRSVAVSAGVRHSLALSESGTVYAWGSNFSGELGTGDGLDRTRPVVVPLPGIAVAIATGLFHSMALLADGRVFAWGYNTEGAVGRGDFIDSPLPVNVAGGWSGRIVGIGAGDRHSLAVDSSGAVWAWGLNDSMQLGDGTLTTRNRPVQTQGVNLN